MLRLVFRLVVLLFIARSLSVVPAVASDYFEDQTGDVNIAPGLWWDPTADGHGLDIQYAGDILFMVLYTYDENGEPVWYTTQGALNDAGEYYGDLLRHSWDVAADKYQNYANWGLISISPNASGKLSTYIEIKGKSKDLLLEPFATKKKSQFVDHSGVWHNPKNSGYGYTFIDRPPSPIAIYYFYDELGVPTWLYGEGRRESADTRSVTFSRHLGACLGCPARPKQVINDYGRASFGFNAQDSGMVWVGVQNSRQWSKSEEPLELLSHPQGLNRLLRYRSEERLLNTLRDRYLKSITDLVEFVPSPGDPVGPYRMYFKHPTADLNANTGVSVMAFDQQGRCVFSYPAGDNKQLRSYAVSEEAGQPMRLLNDFTAEEPSAQKDRLDRLGLYVAKNAVALIHNDMPYNVTFDSNKRFMWEGQGSSLSLYSHRACELSSAPYQIDFEGLILSSFQQGDELFLIWRSNVDLNKFFDQSQGYSSEVYEAHLKRLGFAELIPSIVINGERRRAFTIKELHFPEFDASLATRFMVLTKVNLNDPEKIHSRAVFGDISEFSGAATGIYLFYENNGDLVAHKFSNNDSLDYLGSVDIKSKSKSRRFYPPTDHVREHRGNLLVPLYKPRRHYSIDESIEGVQLFRLSKNKPGRFELIPKSRVDRQGIVELTNMTHPTFYQMSTEGLLIGAGKEEKSPYRSDSEFYTVLLKDYEYTKEGLVLGRDFGFQPQQIFPVGELDKFGRVPNHLALSEPGRDLELAVFSYNDWKSSLKKGFKDIKATSKFAFRRGEKGEPSRLVVQVADCSGPESMDRLLQFEVRGIDPFGIEEVARVELPGKQNSCGVISDNNNKLQMHGDNVVVYSGRNIFQARWGSDELIYSSVSP